MAVGIAGNFSLTYNLCVEILKKVSIATVLSLIVLTYGLIGCAPSSSISNSLPETYAPSTIEQMLRAEAERWKGAPHRMGGIGRKGVDCSGLVMQMYKRLFNIQLPRMTNDQVRLGSPVHKSRIQAGDLVFFRPPNKIRHVGIYLGGGDFVHASKSSGVIVSNMNDTFWRNAYWTARRII